LDSIENLGDNGTIMQFKRNIAEPGLYYITAEDNETVDNVTKVLHSDTIAIMAESPTALDTKLKGKWGGMKTALAAGNKAMALNSISTFTRDKYDQIFTALASQLQTIIGNMQDIELIYVHERLAKYRIKRVHNIDGQEVTISYYIYFVKDGDGIWKIENY